MKNTNCNTIFFDFDGTLVNSIGLFVKIVNETLRHFEYPELSAVEIKFKLTRPIQNLFVDYVVEQRVDEITKFFRKIEHERHTPEHFGLIEGVNETIKFLKEKNFKLAIITNKENFPVKQFLKELDLANYFDLIIGRDDVQNSKPHPESIEKALQFFKVKKESAMLIGDTLNDILAAREAKINCAAVLSGAGTEEELKKENPQWIWKDVNVLKKIFKF